MKCILCTYSAAYALSASKIKVLSVIKVKHSV